MIGFAAWWGEREVNEVKEEGRFEKGLERGFFEDVHQVQRDI